MAPASILAGLALDETSQEILAKLEANPATEATLAAVLAAIPARPALDATVAALADANHADLAAILAKDEAIRALLAGTLTASTAADQAVTGALTGTGQAVAAPVRRGDGYWSINVTGTFVGAFVTELSFDSTDGVNGTFYTTVLRSPGGNATTQGASGPVNGYYGAIPPGATYVRVRASAYTSGSIAVRVSTSAVGSDPLAFVTATLNTSTNYVGRIRAEGVWQDATSTPLAAAGVYNETARDLIATSSGAQFNSGGGVGGAQEYRTMAISDQPGTLCLEVSRDAATWRRIRTIAMSNVGTDAIGAGAIYEADITYKPMTRYARAVFINGPTAQGFFNLQTVMMAA